ncbi:MAG: FeoB small GTPase domain-containing protein [Acidobacteriota bacterium]
MHGHSAALATDAAEALLLVGNPNVGKSVVFGHLTGRYATVSNYPGTTVEIACGQRRGAAEVVLDLPGANSLQPSSEDEQVTRDVLLERAAAGHARVVQVCDAKNLRRALPITIQLAELQVPVAILANMMDECRARGIDLSTRELATELSVDVLDTVATEGPGWRRCSTIA